MILPDGFPRESWRAGKAMKKPVISGLNPDIWQACDNLFVYLFHGYVSFSFYAYMHLTMENL